MYTIWILLALIIVFTLAGYAIYLLLKLKQQNSLIKQVMAKKQANTEQKRAKILADIRYIAQAMLENRCEISEGVIRIIGLLDILSLSERVNTNYPAFFAHFEVIKDHPILQARRTLAKKQRMKLDFKRIQSEAQLSDVILQEAKHLSEFSGYVRCH